MKKIIVILISLIIFGCSDSVKVTSERDKKIISEKSIILREHEAEITIEKILIKLKKQMTNKKTSEKASNEYEEWEYILKEVKIKHEEEQRIKKEAEEKKKKQKFIEEIVFLLIKDDLRDPESYKLDYCQFEYKGNDIYNVTHSYRAKNGFGGYVKNVKKHILTLTPKDFSDSPSSAISTMRYNRLVEWIEKNK